jgi:hypothetical protein
MRAAPPVSYLLGKPRWLYALLTLLLLMTVSLMVAVAVLQPGQHLVVAMGLLLLPAVWMAIHTELSTGAQLRWDGEHWHLTAHGQRVSGQLHLVHDFQRVLLLRWSPPFFGADPVSTWLWIEQNANPVIWKDVRRAVYWNAR